MSIESVMGKKTVQEKQKLGHRKRSVLEQGGKKRQYVS